MVNLGPLGAMEKISKKFDPSDPKNRLGEIRPFGNLAKKWVFSVPISPQKLARIFVPTPHPPYFNDAEFDFEGLFEF